MPILMIRDGARSVVREIESEQPLDTLFPSTPPIPYARGWTVRPDGSAIALFMPDGTRHGTIQPGAALTVGNVTVRVADDPPDAAGENTRSTERLPNSVEARLALLLPSGQRLVLGARTITIGKSSRCDVVLGDATVSAVHCRVIQIREGWIVRDADSTNGTFLGGMRIESARLSPGAVLVLGRTRITIVEEPSQANDDDEDARVGVDGVLVGESAGMVAVRMAIQRYASQPIAVLVQGETGSGKELVARLLHEQSPRARGPFVAINAGAIAPDLVESELFGHERGAFTGALTRRRGVFEEASGGTLFLDEVGELPLAQQAKLLRVLETREVRRVGAEGTIKVDFRLVCATHRDLASRVAEGTFRADLLYRLDLLRVRLPPLRERTSDIPGLARHLLGRIAFETGRTRRLDDAALLALIEHDWPGNVRELYGVLCRAAAEAETDRIGVEHLEIAGTGREAIPFPACVILGDVGENDPVTNAEPETPSERVREPSTTIPPPPPAPGQSGIQYPTNAPPHDLDPERLLALFEACGGNVSRIARATGLARSTVRDRLKRVR